MDEAESFDEKIRASEKLSSANVGESIDIVQNADKFYVPYSIRIRKFLDMLETPNVKPRAISRELKPSTTI